MFPQNPDYERGSADVSRVALEPRMPLLQSMATAWEAGVTERNSENAMEREYARNMEAMRNAGVDAEPSINPESVRRLPRYITGETTPVSDFIRGALSRAPQDPTQEEVERYDSRVEELKVKYPNAGFKTTREMFESVQRNAQEAARREQEREGTMLGRIGGFAGGVAGFMDPDGGVAPLATAIVSAPGVGLRAVLTEGLMQAGVEASLEIGGARTERRMLGLDSSLAGSIERVGFAGLGGAAIRGTGESLRFAGKRWFGANPADPAPPVPELNADIQRPSYRPLPPDLVAEIRKGYAIKTDPELGATRMGEARIIDDLNDVTVQLDAWDGPRPADIRPTVRLPEEVEGVRFSDDIETRRALGRLTVDERARLEDPDTFRVYDRWLARLDAARKDLQAMRGAQDEADRAAFAAQAQQIDARISAIEAEIAAPKTSAKRRRALVEQKNLAMAEKEGLGSGPRLDTPREAKARALIQEIDVKLRDLAPQVGRAYARVRGEFRASKEVKDAVNRMVEAKSGSLRPEDAEAIVRGAREGLMPERPGVVSPASPLRTADAPGGVAEEAASVAKQDAEAYDQRIEAFRASVSSMLKEENDSITIGTQKLKLDEEIEAPNPDGEGSRKITIREMLRELEETEEGLKAMKTCSI